MPLQRRQFLTAIAATPALAMNAHAAEGPADMPHVPWSRHAAIYQVNVRQFSADGTFKAAQADLPRLKALGVDVLWLMPIQPIGVKERKGTLGSYYAIRDYTAVNPEFGSIDDLRKLVKQAHALGMHVIIDWVGNHTAWDNPWVTQHPDWFKKNDKGEIYSVTFKNEAGNMEEWSDVVLSLIHI